MSLYLLFRPNGQLSQGSKRPLALSGAARRSEGFPYQSANFRTDSTPTERVAKSLAPAERISVNVRCQCPSSSPTDSTQAVTRACAVPLFLRERTRSARRL